MTSIAKRTHIATPSFKLTPKLRPIVYSHSIFFFSCHSVLAFLYFQCLLIYQFFFFQHQSIFFYTKFFTVYVWVCILVGVVWSFGTFLALITAVGRILRVVGNDYSWFKRFSDGPALHRMHLTYSGCATLTSLFYLPSTEATQGLNTTISSTSPLLLFFLFSFVANLDSTHIIPIYFQINKSIR